MFEFIKLRKNDGLGKRTGKGNIDTDPEKIERLLTRNVEEIFVEDSLRQRLASGQRLNIKLGFDPTGAKIHIGRAIILRKLKEFQDLGHNIIFIVGNFTAQVGDPSDKLEKRPMLDSQQIENNLKDYRQQIGKIIDLQRATFKYNADWLGKLTFKEIADLAETFSVGQMTERRNFRDRLESRQEVSLREFLYPLMQGYDSVEVRADVEIGGTDQLFNLKAGRTIQKHYSQREQDIMTTVMLEGTDGRKMSTSWGNVINIIDTPNDMFGKIMSLRDDLIVKYFRACTDVDDARVNFIEAGISSGAMNPRDAKIELAKEIVTLYHDTNSAEKAAEDFSEAFGGGGAPSDAIEVTVSAGNGLAEILAQTHLIKSKTEWRRLVDQGGVSVIETGEKITDATFRVSEDATYRIGKKRFIKVKISS